MSDIIISKKATTPYDTFIVEKKNNSIQKDYQTLLPKKKLMNKKLFLSKILNRTKSILKSKSDFSEYMKEYDSIVTKLTFKTPEIQNYPLLRKNKSDMISIKNQASTKNKIVKRKILNNFFKGHFNNSSFKEKFRANLSMCLSSKARTKIKLEEWLKKKKERDKFFLFEDFFYKWNKKRENNNIYLELNYDENKIFYSDYTDFIQEKVNFCRKNKLENLQKKLKIEFEDKKKKKIKLELISMKLIFEPIKEEKYMINKKINENLELNLTSGSNEYNFEDYKEINSTNTNTNNNISDDNFFLNEEKPKKNQIIIFPLSYVFLFYINGLEYFKKILLGSIKFRNDYKNIYFEENEIYNIIRSRKKEKTTFSSMRSQKIKGTIKTQLSKRSGPIKTPLMNRHFISLKNFNNLSDGPSKTKKEGKKSDENFFSTRAPTPPDEKQKLLYTTTKKIKTMHSNQDLKNKLLKKKDIKYNEYCFKWETPNKSYKVRIILPIIIFWSEHINKNVITYCDKELFLFLLKNNFVNWDYYVLNYLLSLKIFRLIILKEMSFYSKIKKIKNKNKDKNVIYLKKEELNKTNNINNISNNYIENFFTKNNLEFINEKTILIKSNRKIFNQFSDNNESYKFFYTDNFSINSLIDFNSFHIFIENNKLNNKICYEFSLNFRQMNYLINISNFENIENFLPKIVQTNFEERKLYLDFSVLEYYNNKIISQLLYQNKLKKNFKKKSFSVKSSNRAKSSYNKKYSWDNMNIVIKLPFIFLEQYVKSDTLDNNVKIIELNLNFLKILKNFGKNFWSEKILQFLDLKNNNIHNISNLELVKVKSNQEYQQQDKHYEELIKNYNNIKRHSKSLHFRVRKDNI